jgi:hypothetical protein
MAQVGLGEEFGSMLLTSKSQGMARCRGRLGGLSQKEGREENEVAVKKETRLETAIKRTW